MAKENLNFKTAFKKFLDSPSDSKNPALNEHDKSNVLPDTVFVAPSVSPVDASSIVDQNIIEQKAKVDAKVTDWLQHCQSKEGSFIKRSGKKYDSREKHSSDINHYGEVPVWNRRNKSDFQEDFPILKKSIASKEQKRKTTKNKMDEEDKAALAKMEANFAACYQLKYNFAKLPDFDGAGIDIFKEVLSINKAYFNFQQEFKNRIIDKPQEIIMIEEYQEKMNELQMELTGDEQKKQMELAKEKLCSELKKLMEETSNKFSNKVQTKEPEKRNKNCQKSKATVKQMGQVDNSSFQNKKLEQVDNSHYQNKQLKQVDNSNYQKILSQDRNFQNKGIPDQSFILKKSDASEKQVESVKNKNGKKKNRKNRKETNEAEMEFYELITARRSYKNIHSSGDVYSSDDTVILPHRKTEIPRPSWERPIIHPIIEQPVSRPVPNPPCLPPPPPPPVPFDEPAWDDDFYNLQNY